MLLPSKTFKDIYRNLNIKMPLEDFNFFIEYMKLNARNFKDEYDESQYIAKIMAGTPVMSKQFKLDEDGDFQPNRTSFYKREKVQLNDCSSRMTLNLRNLCKIVDACAKMYWARMKEKLDDHIIQNEQDDEQTVIEKKIKEMQKKSLSKNPKTPLEILLEKLQQKIRINFANPNEAFRFFDISCKDKITKE